MTLFEDPTFCEFCQSYSIEPYNGEFVCTRCSHSFGQQYMQTAINPSYNIHVKSKYNKKKYRYNLFKPLKANYGAWFTLEQQNKIKNVLNIPGGWTWANMKACIEPHRKWRNIRIFALPKYLGFKFEWKHEWDCMIDQAIQVDLHLEEHGSKISNLYVLYQVVYLTGYYVDWVPISITKTTLRKLNIRWISICKVLNWPYYKIKELSIVSTEGIKHNISKNITLFIPKTAELTWGLENNCYSNLVEPSSSDMQKLKLNFPHIFK